MTPHGTSTRYQNGCRCPDCQHYEACRHLPIDLEQAVRNRELRATRVSVWRALVELGEAGRVCDSIVKTRPAPDALLARVFVQEAS